MPKEEYGAKDLAVLEGLDAVRKRPGMYIGTTDSQGLMHCLWEIIDNSVDEALAGFCNDIVVTLHTDGSVEVADNGRGIPVDKEPKTGLSGVEVVLTKLHAGAKFGNSSYNAVGGLHGVGSSVVNALSSRLDVEVDRDGSVSDRRVCRLDYSVADEIRIEEAYDFSDGGMPERYTVSLNDAGYVRHVELPTAISTPFVCDFGYDDAGRLIRQEWSAGYSSGWTTFDYTDGVVSGGTVCDDEGENSADGFERYFGDVKNDLLNIDPNALFMGGLLYDGTENYSDILGPLDRLGLLRLAGRGSDRYVVRYDGGDESVSGDEMGSWPEPNVTVHQSSEYCEYEWDETLRYAFNDDGSIATVSQEELCTRIRYEYDIVVGDELVNPDYPEGGYKCTIANETRTPVGKGTNTYIYTFTYR